MSSAEILELLNKIGYGHLGCIHEGKPYVISMQYYIKDTQIYIFTDQGAKSHDLDLNPDICLQVEELQDTEHWSSVVVTGRVERLQERSQIDEVSQLIKRQNPTFSPVFNRTWTEISELENSIAFYRIQVSDMTGSKAQGASRRTQQS
jgi:nitroimidazol reductase NimA-like FMN-containing flavoprotein (pyridoxamine 5'-phosphate oxidase superfamily)